MGCGCGGKKRSLPGGGNPIEARVHEKAYTFKEALTDTITGNKEKVPYEIEQERLNICRSCPFLNFPLPTCSQCGCFMPWKVTFAEAECGIKPENGEKKWLAYTN